MKTEIWMPWYIADYHRDTPHLTYPEHGAYLLLIAWLWSKKGSVVYSDKAFAAVIGTTIEDWNQNLKPSLEEFFQVENGVWTHKRVQAEALKAEGNRKRLSEFGKMGGRPKKAQGSTDGEAQGIADEKPKVKPAESPSPSPSPSPSEVQVGERESTRHFPEVEIPGEAEVKAYAATIGLAEWKAVDWFQQMEGNGWVDHEKNQIRKWRPVIGRVKTKWEADGRPMSPPAARVPQPPRTNFPSNRAVDQPSTIPHHDNVF